MDLYFVRHGKTEWNLEGRYQGGSGDSPLLPESIADIKLLANRLSDIDIKHVYSSPLKRAKMTSEVLIEDLGKDIPITLVDDLREFNLGIMEGQKFSDLEVEMPEVVHAFRYSPLDYDYKKIKGESFEDVADRTTKAIYNIVANYGPDDSLVIVGHGASSVDMIQSLLGKSISEIRDYGGLSNTSLTHLDYDVENKKFKLIKWNETDYLNKELDKSDTL
ncbi:histidine phosphatase family protein [Companilactobacillus metriopterae]|uniref:histidine phosphatase family protein n=1 Tax=Companilactobacillus metriopterae TaxID=1909267 RepID=UPI00100A25CC|nr:histidine phosphatase family protein [Companilactobacillus metriopterae]